MDAFIRVSLVLLGLIRCFERFADDSFSLFDVADAEGILEEHPGECMRLICYGRVLGSQLGLFGLAGRRIWFHVRFSTSSHRWATTGFAVMPTTPIRAELAL